MLLSHGGWNAESTLFLLSENPLYMRFARVIERKSESCWVSWNNSHLLDRCCRSTFRCCVWIWTFSKQTSSAGLTSTLNCRTSCWNRQEWLAFPIHANFMQIYTVALERIWKWGAPIQRNFFWLCPSTFLVLKVQLVVLVSAFVMVSTVWSVSRLLFFYSRCPPRAQPFVKVGWARSPVPYGVGSTEYITLDI